MAIWILDKVDFRTNGVKHGITHYIMILIPHENRNSSRKLKVYVPQNRASEYIKQKLIELQGEFYKYTNIVGDFSTVSSVIGRIS